jgi:hypothetical protein
MCGGDSYMANFFPAELSKDFDVVLSAIPQRTFYECPIWFSKESVDYVLADSTITIPYRCYLLEPPESDISKLTKLQKQILFCLYTRSSDGYLREKYVRKLLSSSFEKWCVPYIVKLCDEYVVEILYVIYNSLSEKPNEEIKSFCLANKRTICKSFSRMISYWNEYYRADCCNVKEYVGWKLYRECLGYSRAFVY